MLFRAFFSLCTDLPHDQSKEQTPGTNAQPQQSSETLKVEDGDSEKATSVPSCSSPARTAPNVDGDSGTDKQCGSPGHVDQDQRVGDTVPPDDQ